jgi:hypothetical protein
MELGSALRVLLAPRLELTVSTAQCISVLLALLLLLDFVMGIGRL